MNSMIILSMYTYFLLICVSKGCKSNLTLTNLQFTLTHVHTLSYRAFLLSPPFTGILWSAVNCCLYRIGPVHFMVRDNRLLYIQIGHALAKEPISIGFWKLLFWNIIPCLSFLLLYSQFAFIIFKSTEDLNNSNAYVA